MATTYMALEDSLLQILTSLEAERNPVERLRAIRRLEATSTRAFRKLKREAAYEARMTMPAIQIAELLEMDRKDVEYLVRVYLVDNPHAPEPPRRQRKQIDQFVDLSRE